MQQVKTTRIDWRTRLVTLHSMILAMAKFHDIGNRYDSRLADYIVVSNFYDLVPQDRELLIVRESILGKSAKAKQPSWSPELVRANASAKLRPQFC